MTKANKVSGLTFDNVNTNKGNKMTNPKIRIAVNINRSKGFAMPETGATIGGLHNGRISFHPADHHAFISFNPVPLSENGKFTPVYRVFENGTIEELDRVEFWAGICGTDENGNVKASIFSMDLDEKAKDVVAFVNKLGMKAIHIEFDESADNAFHFLGAVDSMYKGAAVKLVGLRAGDGMTYDFSEHAAHADKTHLSGSVVRDAVKAASRGSIQHGIVDVNAATFGCVATTVSSRRRATRKAAHEEVKAAAPQALSFDSFEAPAAKVKTPPTPQNDMAAMIQQAVAAAIAPLTQEISSLRDELKAKDAEIEALKAAQAQPVAPRPQSEAARASLDSAVKEAAPKDVADEAPAELTEEELMAQFLAQDQAEFKTLNDEEASFDSFDADEEDEDLIFGSARQTTTSEAAV